MRLSQSRMSMGCRPYILPLADPSLMEVGPLLLIQVSALVLLADGHHAAVQLAFLALVRFAAL